MDRREYLATVVAIGAGVIAGCTETAETESQGTTSTGMTTEPTSTKGKPSQTKGEEATTQKSTTESGNPNSTYKVRISYEGEWTGSIVSGDSSRSIDGSGTTTIDVEGSPLIVSANAQKQDDSSRELTVAILEDGEVVAEQSTGASYGVAQVTSEDGSNSTGDSGGSSFQIRVQYDGQWQGSVGTGGSTRSIDGNSSNTIDIEGAPTTIAVNAQKQDDGSGKLTVQILKDGEVVKEASTTAEYGVAQVTYTDF